MAKAIIVYESKYGNTKLAAETIAQGMNQVPETEAVLTEVDKLDLTQIDKFDVILVGSPNHTYR
jgi:flavodoxin